MAGTNGETLTNMGCLSPERLKPCDLLVLEPSCVLRCGIIVVVMISGVTGVVIRDAAFKVPASPPRGKWCWRPAVVSLTGHLMNMPGALPP